MTQAELIKEHKKKYCDKCNLSIDCTIYFTQNGETRCENDQEIK